MLNLQQMETEMEIYHPILKRCPLFAGVEEKDVAAMLRCLDARRERRGKGERILSAGDAATWVGVVLSGAVEIQRLDYDGSRRILAHLAPGELFAESFACAGVESLSVDVVAVEDTELLRLDVWRITHSCSNACAFHARLIYNLLREVSAKNLLFFQKLEVTSKRTTRERLLTYLEMCAREQGSRRFTVPFDRQGLADFLGVDRSGLSAEIGRLRSEGVLESRRSEFTLLS